MGIQQAMLKRAAGMVGLSPDMGLAELVDAVNNLTGAGVVLEDRPAAGDVLQVDLLELGAAAASALGVPGAKFYKLRVTGAGRPAVVAFVVVGAVLGKTQDLAGTVC